ncbi:outer membrane protein [Rhodoligotrophos defluvii]|uniref:outer membrane protein n=1 Tax=Rhodoligotrophos defluvii TaxID=2561934 RepID=UPI0010CA0A11|nr:outer membrane beta-barrel protein [Rhodoligotrophos defluvii]
MRLVRWTSGLATAMAALGVVPALAADLPVYEPPAAISIPAPYKPWQGFSLGLLGTYGFGEHEHKLSHLDMDGPMFGGLAGIHGQMGNWVLGAEFDGSFGSISGSRGHKLVNELNRRDPSMARRAKVDSSGDPVKDKDGKPIYELIKTDKGDTKAPAEVKVQGETKEQRQARLRQDFDSGRYTYPAKASIDEFYSFRARLGYAFDNMLLYGTGGVGVAHAKLKTEHPYWGEYSDARYGVTPVVGGGVEYKFTDALSLRAEYLYAFPFNVAMKTKLTEWKPQNRTNASFDGSHMIRAGITYYLPAF